MIGVYALRARLVPISSAAALSAFLITSTVTTSATCSAAFRRGLRAGSPATRLTTEPIPATSPSWSPNGRSIVYSALAPGSPAYQIVVAHADGSEPVQLTQTSDAGNTQPVFAPDGRS